MRAATPRGSQRWVPVVMVVALVVSGCVEHEVVIKLRPDGSGTIVETTLAGGEMAEMMVAMRDMEGAEQEDGRAKAESRAATLGPGVTLVSWEELTEGGIGEKVVYSFENIADISVSQAPDSEEGPGDGERVGFRFSRQGRVSEVVAVLAMPDDEEAAAPAAEDGESSGFSKRSSGAGMEDMAAAMGEGMMEMMKPFLEGFKTSIVVEVEGEVVDTNAPSVDGSAVTLMAVDFDQVLATEGAWEKMTALGDEQNLVVVGQALEGVPGVSVPSTPEVTIRFRGN